MRIEWLRGLLVGSVGLIAAALLIAGALWPTAAIIEGQDAPAHDSTSTQSGHSRNWAGYAATSGTFTSVSGTWTVPSPSAAGPRSSDATWVGIGGVNRRDLIQAGTANAIRRDGSLRSQAWVEMLPHPSSPIPLTVHPGDSVTASISQASTDSGAGTGPRRPYPGAYTNLA